MAVLEVWVTYETGGRRRVITIEREDYSEALTAAKLHAVRNMCYFDVVAIEVKEVQ